MKFIFLAWMLSISLSLFSNEINTQPKRVFFDFEYSLSGFNWTEFKIDEKQFSEKLVNSWIKKISETNQIEVLNAKKAHTSMNENDLLLNLYVKIRKSEFKNDQFGFSYKIDYTFLNRLGNLVDQGQNFEGSYFLNTDKKNLADNLGRFLYSQSANQVSSIAFALSRTNKETPTSQVSVRYQKYSDIEKFIKKLNENFSNAYVKSINDEKAILEIEGNKAQVEIVINSLRKKGNNFEFVKDSRGIASDSSL